MTDDASQVESEKRHGDSHFFSNNSSYAKNYFTPVNPLRANNDLAEDSLRAQMPTSCQPLFTLESMRNEEGEHVWHVEYKGVEDPAYASAFEVASVSRKEPGSKQK